MSNNFSVSYPSHWDTTSRDSFFIFCANHRAKNGSGASLMVSKDIWKKEVTVEWILSNMDEAFRPTSAIIENELYATPKGEIYGVFTYDKPDEDTRQLVRTTVACFTKGKTIIHIGGSYNKSENAKYNPLFKTIMESIEFLK